MTLPNQEMSDYWADGSRMWVANQRLMDHVFQPITDALGAALAPGAGDRVVDIGCGTGTLCELAVARGAQAVGVDISGPMVEAARARVPGATFVVADAQAADLAAPIAPERYTAATSRFGVMFFADPAAAFANVRRCLRPRGAPGVRLLARPRREPDVPARHQRARRSHGSAPAGAAAGRAGADGVRRPRPPVRVCSAPPAGTASPSSRST